MKTWFTLIHRPALVVRAHYTWLVLLPLGLWSLAYLVLPQRLSTPGTPWALALAVVAVYLGLVVLHEAAHLLVARLLRVPMPALNLHPLGTLARLGRETGEPGRVFVVAAAGPAANLLLWLALGLAAPGTGTTAALLLDFARSLTLTLAVINLLPGLPLDGGRMLRAVIWFGSDFELGTRVATIGGYPVAGATLLLGLRWFASPDTLLRGVWVVLLAWLIYGAGATLTRRRAVERLFTRLTAGDVMVTGVMTVPPTLTLRELVTHWGASTGENPTAVVADGVLLGLITRSRVATVLQGYWATRTVGETVVPADALVTVGPQTPLARVLPHIDPEVEAALPVVVVEQGRLVGLIDPDEVGPLVEVREVVGLRRRSGGGPHGPGAADVEPAAAMTARSDARPPSSR